MSSSRHRSPIKGTRRKLKQVALYGIRALGGFALARRITAKRLRILCYHGFSVADEHEHMPSLFITETTLRNRMEYLREQGYQVVHLAEGLDLLRAGRLDKATVVVTIDDGFWGTLSIANPIFQELRLPTTLYVTTYYVENQDPVFNLAVQYLLKKAHDEILDLRPLLVARGDLSLDWGRVRVVDRDAAAVAITDHGFEECSKFERRDLLRRLALCVGEDPEFLERTRAFSLVSEGELRVLSESGMRIELHTHRHRSPSDPELARRELRDNSAVIERATGTRPMHFCYPSGVFDPWSRKVFQDEGIRSATTVQSGLAVAKDDPYLLPRFLDGENCTQIEFEAMLAGVFELL